MKKIFTSFAALLVLAFAQNANAQTFVNQAATGNNDGTSWADAYTELADALDNYAPDDEIWVAAGTYLPQNPTAWPDEIKQTFYLFQNVSIYGGFDGTETMLSERDPAANVTILSGDLNDDDVDDDFETNREDNVINVMYVDSLVTTLIDGFTISGGHADGDDSFLANQWGGGVFSFGVAQVSNCTVEYNYASDSGAGLTFYEAAAAGSSVQNCLFQINKAEDGGGAMGCIFQADITIDACQFIDNEAGSIAGGAVAVADALASISNCEFTGNSSGWLAGALYFQIVEAIGSELNVTDCNFENNTAETGGAFYFFSGGGDNCNVQFSGCDFTGNSAISAPTSSNFPDGGAMAFEYAGGNPANNNIIITNCILENNTAERLGGGISFFNSFGTDKFLEISNSQFLGNTSSTDGGGFTLLNYGGSDTEVNLIGCDFANNTTDGVGGGIHVWNTSGTGNEFTLSGCDFLNNHADQFGGGFRIESNVSDASFTVEDCLFDGNNANVDGGGMEVVYYVQGDGETTIINTDFLNNTSGNEAGGLNFFLQDQASGSLTVDGSLFSGNTNNATGNAVEGAGGFSLINFGNGIANVDFQSSIFENNSSEDGAGAIQLYKTGTTTDLVNLENCLLANNSGGDFAGGIGIAGNIELSVKNSTIADNSNGGISIADGQLEMQNTILHNPGSDDFFSPAANNVTSLGGNLVGDDTMDDFLGSTDQSSTDPLFETGTFQLSQNSSAVDAGVLTNNLSEFDLSGNDRIQGSCIDIGAYESEFDAGVACVTNTREILADPSQIAIYPNPVFETVNIALENDWRGELNLRIVNTLGQVIEVMEVEKQGRSFVLEIAVQDLPTGIYQVLIANGEMVAVSTFVKN